MISHRTHSREERATTARSIGERAAAAVELALVLPILLALVFGIIQFGQGYAAKVQLTGAVREGARALALGKSSAQATQAVRDAAPGLTIATVTVGTACPTDGTDAPATVSATYSLPALAYVPGLSMSATGVMRCGL